ncbi:MAG: hypothetical protein EOP48_05170, partial [Sphingobacteriales bacterium]
MSKQPELNSILRIVLLIISLGLWYIYYRYQKRQKNKQKLIKLLPEVQKATLDFAPHFSGEKYFAHYDYVQIRNAHQTLLSEIPEDYRHYNLTQQEHHIVDYFFSVHHDQESMRETYNNKYTLQEIRKFSPFFSTLEKYPLSEEQMLAVVSEEDNNL